jgi:hypothetical protein
MVAGEALHNLQLFGVGRYKAELEASAKVLKRDVAGVTRCATNRESWGIKELNMPFGKGVLRVLILATMVFLACAQSNAGTSYCNPQLDSETDGHVTGYIVWGGYEYDNWETEDNDTGWGTADFGGKLTASLAWLKYEGSTTATNDDAGKVWVEDNKSCALTLDDDTTQNTIFAVSAQGPGGCRYKYESKVWGHWKGMYEGDDAAIDAAGSFTAICMAGASHVVNFTYKTSAGFTSTTNSIEVEGATGQKRTGEVSAEGVVKGLPVGAKVGNEIEQGAKATHTISESIQNTAAANWDVKHQTTSKYSLLLTCGSAQVTRTRELSWSWSQIYDSLVDETPIRRGNTSKVQWAVGTVSYRILPYSGEQAPADDQACNPVGQPIESPNLPRTGSSRTATVVVYPSRDGEPFAITAVSGVPNVVNIDGMAVSALDEANFDAVVSGLCATATTGFTLFIHYTATADGDGLLELTRTGGMPDFGDVAMEDPVLTLPVSVGGRGFVLQGYESWESTLDLAAASPHRDEFSFQLAVGATLQLVIDVGATLEAPEAVVVTLESGEGFVLVGSDTVPVGEPSVTLRFTAEGEPGSTASYALSVAGRTIYINLTIAG